MASPRSTACRTARQTCSSRRPENSLAAAANRRAAALQTRVRICAAHPDVRDLPAAELTGMNNLINAQLAHCELSLNLQEVLIRTSPACLCKTLRKITRLLPFACVVCLHLTFFLFVWRQLFFRLRHFDCLRKVWLANAYIQVLC